MFKCKKYGIKILYIIKYYKINNINNSIKTFHVDFYKILYYKQQH